MIISKKFQMFIYAKKHLLLILLLLSSLPAGCVKTVLPPFPTLDLSQLDVSPVKGKTIVIDPGHGGTEHGAVGVKGLMESEVNLGVALYLWGLLKDAGARPVLTRSSDKSFVTVEEFSLKQDLQARSNLSNRYKADLLVSIHHNSNIKNRKRNDLSIFYKMSDPGQSCDIAREISNVLAKKLKSETANIHPGNYHVLRNTDAPAVLGEASFISNKKNETILSFHRTLSSEAEGYFIGILNYYQKGIPCITDLYPEDMTLSSTQPEITAHIHPGSASASIDPSSIKVTLDGKATTLFSFQDEGLISLVPETSLQNGKHEFCVSVRNTSGNTSGEKCASFTVSLPPHYIKVSPIFSVIPADGMASTPVDIEVLDSLKRPVIDGTEVKLSATGGGFLNPIALTRKGKARAVVTSDEKSQKITLTVKSGNAVSQCKVKFGIPEEALFMATIRDSSGNPVEKAALIRNARQVAVSDSSGNVYDRVDTVEKISYRLMKKGYYPLRFTPSLSPEKLAVENLLMEPVDYGVFFDKKIILDPACSSTESPPVITELKKRIENAGGSVILTWENPPCPSAHERVARAGKEHGDIFLIIEITKKTLSAGYYHKSIQGKELANRICAKLKENKIFKNNECKLVTSTRYVMIHTDMPAIWISLPESSIASAMHAADSIYKALGEAFKTLFQEAHS